MPPRKSNVSIVSNGADESPTAEVTPAKATKEKDGLSVDDLSLPKSMIARLAKGILPPNTQIQKDALLALHKSATVFVSYIASSAHENAQNGGKKTIMPLDVMAALKDTEFEWFLPRLEAELKKYNDTQCDKRNTYRRKIKEERAAATAKGEDGDATEYSGILQANGATPPKGVVILPANGHEMSVDDAERPSKKLKAIDGEARLPGAGNYEDEDDVDMSNADNLDAEDEDDDEDDGDAGDDEEDDEDDDGDEDDTFQDTLEEQYHDVDDPDDSRQLGDESHDDDSD